MLGALSIEDELGHVVGAVIEVDGRLEAVAVAEINAAGEVVEGHVVTVGAIVNTGGIAAKILNSGGSDGLEVFVLEVSRSLVVSIEGGNQDVLGSLGHSSAIGFEGVKVIFQVLDVVNELILLSSVPALEFELAAASVEASLVEVVDPCAVEEVIGIGLEASHATLVVASGVDFDCVLDLLSVLNERLDQATVLHKKLTNGVLVGVLKGLLEVSLLNTGDVSLISAVVLPLVVNGL